MTYMHQYVWHIATSPHSYQDVCKHSTAVQTLNFDVDSLNAHVDFAIIYISSLSGSCMVYIIKTVSSILWCAVRILATSEHLVKIHLQSSCNYMTFTNILQMS